MSRKIVAVPIVTPSTPEQLVRGLEANLRPLVDDFVLLEPSRTAHTTLRRQQELAREMGGEWFLNIHPWERLEQDAGVALRRAADAALKQGWQRVEVCPLASPSTFSPGRLEERLRPVEEMLETSRRGWRKFWRSPGDLGVRMYDLRPLLGGSGGRWRPLEIDPERSFYPPVSPGDFS